MRCIGYRYRCPECEFEFTSDRKHTRVDCICCENEKRVKMQHTANVYEGPPE